MHSGIIRDMRRLIATLAAVLQLSACATWKDVQARQTAEPLLVSLEYCSAGDPPQLSGLAIFQDGFVSEYGPDLTKHWRKLRSEDLARALSLSQSRELLDDIGRSARPSFSCSGSPAVKISLFPGNQTVEVGFREPLQPEVQSLLAFGNDIGQRYFRRSLFITEALHSQSL